MSVGVINHNLMAANTAANLNSHYSRLAISTQRLSSGLRVNSAADDAAGLAIRELMRSDVSATRQGMRNANDAISLLQVADGALAVIDEKLIRMKELAEQAATGTYDSTQRLMIDSEYRAMADEIDRIARATDFNGIKLLDGSLAGEHDGRQMQAAGRLKVHFGSANDSAEDYYYISIGDCTTAGLGLGSVSLGDGPGYIEREYFEVDHKYFAPQPSYDAYEDPDTGKVYYTDGVTWFPNPARPAASALDWEKHADIIARLRRKPATLTTHVEYRAYEDTANPGVKYYTDGWGPDAIYTANPHDESSKRLDPANPADKVIIDRLKYISTEKVTVDTEWYTYKNPAGTEYYTCDGGTTFVPDPKLPKDNVLDSNIPAHAQAIKELEQVFDKKAYASTVTKNYLAWKDPVTGLRYYSADGGKTMVSDLDDPANTKLDPQKHAAILARLVVVPDEFHHSVYYDTYHHAITGYSYYTNDGGKTFVHSPSHPSIAFRADDPNDAADIALLSPVLQTTTGNTVCQVYEDTANNNQRYYTKDKGQTFFSSLTDPEGSVLDKSDPGYAALVANFQKTASTVTVSLTYERWQNASGTEYYTNDGGKTFIRYFNTPDVGMLDSSNPAHQAAIARLKPLILQGQASYTYMKFVDGVTGIEYYRPWNGTEYITDMARPQDIALDPNNPAHMDIINRLQVVQDSYRRYETSEFPDKMLVYLDHNKYQGYYYSHDGGQTFTSDPMRPYDPTYMLDPSDPEDKKVLDRLKPVEALVRKVERIPTGSGGAAAASGAGATVSTQQAAQEALVAIDNAIVSKDKIRAHLGALQNRLENTVTNLSIQGVNLEAAEARISDTDVAREMTQFVRNQILTQSAVAMLGQANSFPHMLASLING